MSVVKKGSTPNIKVLLTKEEVPDTTIISHIYMTFAQSNNVLYDFTFSPNAQQDQAPTGGSLQNTDAGIYVGVVLTQTQTKSLSEDVKLQCEVNVTTTELLSDNKPKRLISKTYEWAVCGSLKGNSLLD